eukprot:scpid38497/ scgid32190/ 
MDSCGSSGNDRGHRTKLVPMVDALRSLYNGTSSFRLGVCTGVAHSTQCAHSHIQTSAVHVKCCVRGGVMRASVQSQATFIDTYARTVRGRVSTTHGSDKDKRKEHISQMYAVHTKHNKKEQVKVRSSVQCR